MSDINEPGQNSQQATKKTVSVVANDDGSVVITSANGKVKHRKGQSEEAFQEQLRDFWSAGPKINEHGWLTESYNAEMIQYQQLRSQGLSNLDIRDKLTVFDVREKSRKNQLINTAENHYYHRKYANAMEVCDLIIELFDVFDVVKKNKREIEEVNNIKSHCRKKLDSQ
ncbi:hypothetical protein DASC09_001640 [Saccharomycopsis crataegensis]|uniref:Uncharacterized protein n=1 Tax=Saccharomycopsis crataegensis TaxID=43959 RepID=A0AAV5QDT0_9ASCO|nr:hypothetical protein DASC09_001640 [Saccharomycopsis crataegensis]